MFPRDEGVEGVEEFIRPLEAGDWLLDRLRERPCDRLGKRYGEESLEFPYGTGTDSGNGSILRSRNGNE